MLPHLHIIFCKLLFRLFQLLQLQIPICRIVYDTGFRAKATDDYNRYLITHSRRGFCLWHVSFCVLKPLHIQQVGWFEYKLSAMLALRLPDNLTISAIQTLFSRNHVLAVSDRYDLATKAAEVAKADGLDDFVELRFCWSGQLEYLTLHGKRCLNVEDSNQCQFIVTETDNSFVKAVPLPYTFQHQKSDRPWGILVVHPAPWDTDAHAAGYARAVALRCQYVTASGSGDYPDGALIVAVDPSDREARAAGYADAIPLALSQNRCSDVEDLGMPDTDVATDFELGYSSS